MEFERWVTYFDGDISGLEAKKKKVDVLLNSLEKRVKSVKGLNLDVGVGKGFSQADAAMRRAQADIARMQRQTAAGEAALTRQIDREAEAQFRARVRSYQRAMQENLRFARQQRALEARNAGGGLDVTDGLAGARGVLAGVGVTATGVAYGVGRAAIEMDNLENVLIAATGSADAAQKKLHALNEVAKVSPGVMLATAASTYALLKPMGIAEKTIDSLTQALGRIKLARPNTDLEEFAFNLNQIPTAFDKADFKQAVENFPRFGEIIKKQFNLKSAKDDIEGLIAELKKLKASGRLTKDSWLAGFAEGVNKDVSLGKLGDTIETKFNKLTEALKVKVAPLGESVVEVFLAGFSPTKDTEGGYQDFGNSMSTFILSGYAKAIKGLGLAGPGDSFYVALERAIAEKEKAAKIRILEKSKKNWEGVIANPLSSPEAVDAAKKSLESVRQKLYTATFGERDAANDAVTLSIGKSMGKLFASGVKKGMQESAPDVRKTANAILGSDNSHQIRMALLGDNPLGLEGQRDMQVKQNLERRRYLREQISLQQAHFSAQIQLHKDDVDKLADVFKDRNETISKLDTELRVTEIRAQKEVADIERRIADERRRDLIDFKNIEIRGITEKLNTRSRLIEDQLDSESGLSSAGYSELIDITQRAYAEIAQLTAESYDLQLEDASLTAQQRNNILQQKFQEELALREANAAQVQEINNRAANAFRNGLERQFQITQRLYGDRADAYRQIPGVFFSPDTFSSRASSGFQSLIEGGRLKAELARVMAEENSAKNRLDKAIRDGLQPETLGLLEDQYNRLLGSTGKAMVTLEKFTDSVPGQYREIARLGQELSLTSGKFENFDAIAAKGLRASHLLEIANLEAEIGHVGDQLQMASGRDAADLAARLRSLKQSLLALQMKQHADEAAQYARSLAGLRETLGFLQTGDTGTANAMGYLAESTVLQEMISGYAELAVLKQRLSRSSELQALELEKAAVNDLIELERVRTQVLIESQRSVEYRLAMQLAQLPTYQAQLTEFFASLPTSLSDVWTQTLQNFDGTWSGFLTTLRDNFLRTINQMIADMLRAQMIRGLVGLFGGLFGGGAASSGGGAASMLNLNTISGFADGGVPPTNRVSVVGENGPELFVPSVAGRILSNGDSKAAIVGTGGASQIVVHNHFHANERTGAFHKPSAVQAARDTSDYLRRVTRD